MKTEIFRDDYLLAGLLLVALLMVFMLSPAGLWRPSAPATSVASVLRDYQRLAQVVFGDTRKAADELRRAVETLIATPSSETLANARIAWRRAKMHYSMAEAFRFDHWPVDEYDIRVNSWPLDEGLIDYVAEPYVVAPENPLGRANIIGSTQFRLGSREINVEHLSAALIDRFHAIAPVESAVVSGFHAIEFLLWGQDLNPDGPGQRPWTDYKQSAAQCTNGNQFPGSERTCQRRAQFLRATAQILSQDLVELERIWADDAGSYGTRLARGNPEEGLRRILFSLAVLAADELAGERLLVPLRSAGQEDEQDCFSDGTHLSIAGNLAGLEAVYTGRYPALDGTQMQFRALRDLLHGDPLLVKRADAAVARANNTLRRVVARANRGESFDRQIDALSSEARRDLFLLSDRLKELARRFEEIAIALQVGRMNPATASQALPAGGGTTVNRRDPDVVLSPRAFSEPAANLSPTERTRFAVGNSFFTAAWVSAPASTGRRDGLGPYYNAAACQNCHIRDGRGHPPTGPGDDAVSSVVRIGDALGRADPRYGRQIQDHAIKDFQPEAVVRLEWIPSSRTLAGGQTLALRTPQLTLDQLSRGPLGDGIRNGLRIAPPMIGVGLLETIPAAGIRAAADPNDRDSNGISGRTRELADGKLGRFGWKAAQPSVDMQVAAAFHVDMGLSSRHFPKPHCVPTDAACGRAPTGGEPEVDADVLADVSFYARHLAVPARRWTDTEEVRAGEMLFAKIGCAACHQPQWHTGPSEPFPALAGQIIRPYTDMLLHDMGPGLSDGVGEPGVAAEEWRTPPLWGLHLTKAAGGSETGYLHDGRAVTLEEAILWHGGEAARSATAFAELLRPQRDQLIWFLKSL